ncbi:MAG: MFS transporter [Acidimicrobiales bacterium]
MSSTTTVDATGLERLRQCRRDIVDEAIETAGEASTSYRALRAPFDTYRRQVDVRARSDGRFDVEQRIDYTWALPLWWVLFALPARRVLRKPAPKPPWWAPPDPLDQRAASVLALLCTVSVIAGYLGTVITQTITFASDEFHKSNGVQGVVLALTRVGVIISMILLAAADRRGRRTVTIGATAAGCAFTVLGAFSPNIWVLGLTQTLARGVTTALAMVILVAAAEELPAGSRAYGVSVLALAAGLGAGMAVWVLPLADLGTRGWRLIYLLPALGLPLTVYVARRLPETKRFEVSEQMARVKNVSSINRQRLLLLAVSSFLVLMFRSPASQLQNEFLKDERGFSASRIALFTVVTSTPVGLGVMVGGRLADVRGRRAVAAVGLVVGSLGTAIAFLAHGWPLWAWQAGGIIVGAVTIPALGTYGPEMFSTRSRGRANGLITLAGMAGSSFGLIVAGVMSDHVGLGKALLVLSVGPLLVAALVVLRYPETAHIELEVLNPDDQAPSGPQSGDTAPSGPQSGDTAPSGQNPLPSVNP